MNEEVARLVHEQRLLDAARLADSLDDPSTASVLYERACAWGSAARAALRAGDVRRALELAVEAGDDALASEALARVGPRSPGLEVTAARLATRGGHGGHAWAARLYEASDRKEEAAVAWERAGDAVRAAELREAMGDAPGAARSLEAGLRRDPRNWRVTVELGALLVRYERLEAAVRVLQRVPPDAGERRRSVALLAVALRRLGLLGAAEEVLAEAASRGWVLEPASGEFGPGELGAKSQATLFGRYSVRGEVSSSPTARVLDCFDPVRGERVAVKLFAGWDVRGGGRDAVARFDREVRAMRALDHPHVVPLIDFVVEGPAMVLAWMEGGSLESLLAAPHAIAPARAIEIALAVLSALGEAHRLGILHRDVKPANVLFDAAGGARLSDFGVAHLGDVSTTATAGAFGTVAYMSPEQRDGRPATARSDVYSVGVLLREMVTRDRAGLETPGLLPSDAHRALDHRHDRVFAAMTSADPSMRPADAFAAREALLALPWPNRADTLRLGSPALKPAWDATRRLEIASDGRLVDGWTGRIVETAPISGSTLERARAYARADHPGLQTVLRVDREAQAVWLDHCRELSPARPLTEEERATLYGALSALHAAGSAHGSVDRAHVGISGSGALVLRFEAREAGRTPEDDRRALSRL